LEFFVIHKLTFQFHQIGCLEEGHFKNNLKNININDVQCKLIGTHPYSKGQNFQLANKCCSTTSPPKKTQQTYSQCVLILKPLYLHIRSCVHSYFACLPKIYPKIKITHLAHFMVW